MPTPINLTPREDRIHRRLLLVGPGPAAFFADACRIMAAPNDLATTTHLMGHLLREIESGLRAVLGVVVEPGAGNATPAESAVPSASAAREPTPKDRHARQIRILLNGLGIPLGEPVAVYWLSLTGDSPMALHRWAHRDRLAAPRPVDQALVQLWDDLQRLLDSVLDRFESRYATIFGRLDAMLGRPAPTQNDLEALAESLPWAPVVQHYFFERLASPGWLLPLHDNRLLPMPPPPEVTPDGRQAFPSWPAAPYLQRMASVAPDGVVGVLAGLTTSNITARAQFLEIAAALPADRALKLVPRILEWAPEFEQFFGADRAVAFAAHLATGGLTDAAIDVLTTMLQPPTPLARPVPAAQADNAPLADSGPGAPSPAEDAEPELREEVAADEANPWRDRQTPWFVRDASNTVIPRLLETAPSTWFAHVLSLLERWLGALSAGRPLAEGVGIYDWSPWWGPELVGSAQDPPDDLRTWLAGATLTAARAVIDQDAAQLATVLERLRRSPYLVARRLELLVLAQAPQAARALVRERLLDRAWLHSRDLAPEYVALLAAAFPQLEAADRAAVVGAIRQGPQLPPPDDESPEHIAHREGYRTAWRRDRLAVVRPHLLEADRAALDALITASGPAAPVIHNGLEATAGFIGPTSPLSAQALASFAPTELVDYLREWRPSGQWHTPTPEGLARVLAARIAETPGPYAADAMQFTTIAPTYLRAVFEGLREAVRHERAFNWEAVLEAGQWVVAQAIPTDDDRGGSFDADSDLRPTRRALAALLVQGLHDGPLEVPIQHRAAVCEVLMRLCEDPNPTPDYEAQYGGTNMDPFTLSLNTTRPEGIRGVLLYAQWVQRHGPPERRGDGFALVPEAEAVVRAHLDPATDPSLAVRAAIGERLPWLIHFDRRWVTHHLGLLLPADLAGAALRDALWDAFITWTRPYDGLLDILTPAFREAIERLGRHHVQERPGGQRPEERLAEHLMTHYWHGRVTLDSPDGLVQAFFARADGRRRARAIHFIGWSLTRGRDGAGKADAPVPAEVTGRLAVLWSWRLATAEAQMGTGDASPLARAELEEFGWWVASRVFEPRWALGMLARVLGLTGRTANDRFVVSYLAELASSAPEEVLACLDAYDIHGGAEPWRVHVWREEARAALRTLRANATPSVREAAGRLVNRWVAHGYIDFRELLDP
jgi:hypothetical protein